MSADYLIAGLRSVELDGPVPVSVRDFAALCREQLSAKDADGVCAVLSGAASSHPLAVAWRDLESQIRNALAEARAAAAGKDASKWRRAVAGCSVYWANRATAAFQEKDVMKRQRAIDRVFWDAAGELVPAAAPLSVAAAFEYAIRLRIAETRAGIDVEAGNRIFNRLTAVDEAVGK